MILEIIPEHIRHDEWAGTYDATLRLLLASPSPLMGLDWVVIGSTRLPVYTQSIERYVDMPDRRRWCIVGEQATLRVAETQTMHRDIEHYRRAGRQSLPPDVRQSIPHDVRQSIPVEVKDILEAAVDERVARRAGLVSVFGDVPRDVRQSFPHDLRQSSTKEHPYELALLGAAMVVETRLPLHAMISGYVEREQAEAAQRFAQSALQEPVLLPVRIDGPRLAERLGRFIDGDSISPIFSRLRVDTPRAAEASRPPARRSSLIEVPLPDIEDLLVLPSPDDLSPRLRDEVHALALSVRRTQIRVRDKLGRAAAQRPGVSVGPLALLVSNDASTLRLALGKVLEEHGPILTEHTTARVTREGDLEMLRFLLTVALLHEGGPNLFPLQRAMFENDGLCRYALEASQNGPLMAHVAQQRGTPPDSSE